MKNSRLLLLMFLFSLFLMENSFDLLAQPIPGIQGTGSYWNPYLINNVPHQGLTTSLQKLNKIANWVNKTGDWDKTWTSEGKYFKLGYDITGFTSTIGTEASPFMGAFYGNGHRIDVSINKSASFVGLFGKAKNAVIENLTVTGSVTGLIYVGGIVGYGSNVWIEHCTNLANVTAKEFSLPWLLNNNNSNKSGITKSISPDLPGPQDTSIHAMDTLSTNPPLIMNGYFAGGIMGYGDTNGVTIVKCANDGWIIGSRNVGGILGHGSNKAEVLRCTNIGTVRGIGNAYYIGGIVGIAANTIENSMNGGFVVGKQYVGGITGYCGKTEVGDIRYCLNTGVIHGNQSTGSIAGYMLNTTNAVNNFYDKQMSSKGGIGGNDVANRAEGKLTSELTGDNLISWGALWTMHTWYNPQLYPTPIDVGNVYYNTDHFNYSNDHLEHVAAATLELDAGYNLWETTDSILSGIFYTHIWQAVYWTAQIGNVTVYNSDNTIRGYNGEAWDTYSGYFPNTDTMSAACYGYSKQVPIYILPNVIHNKTTTETNYTTNTFSASEVTPNIVTSNATIDIQTSAEGNLNVSIYDLAGTKVANITDRFVSANSSLQVDLNNLSNLAAGSYMAVVAVGNEVVMRKFVRG